MWTHRRFVQSFFGVATTPIVTAIGVSAALLLATVSSSFGASPLPPQKSDCDIRFDPNEFNDRLDCKTENVNTALFDFVDRAIDFDQMRTAILDRPSLFTDKQKAHLLAARDRAQKAKNRTREAKGFRAAVKKQKAEDEDCFIKELIGDGKGDEIQPCEKAEDCEEVIGDGIGNDVQPCSTKGKNKEVCVQICQQPLLTDEENLDGEIAFDIEQGLEELEGVLLEADQQVALAMIAEMQAWEQRQLAATVPSGLCGEFVFDLFPFPFVSQITQVTKNVADAVFNSCSVACNQDAFGWNCEAACVAFAVIAGIANTVNDAFELIDDGNAAAQLDRVAQCTGQLDGALQDSKTRDFELGAKLDNALKQIGDSQGKIDGLKAQIEDLTAQLQGLNALVNAKFSEVITSLCTPQGRRECFPSN